MGELKKSVKINSIKKRLRNMVLDDRYKAANDPATALLPQLISRLGFIDYLQTLLKRNKNTNIEAFRTDINTTIDYINYCRKQVGI